MEKETRRLLCGGQILLRIRLAPDEVLQICFSPLKDLEVASLYEPEPLFSLVPRVAYLPFLFHDVLEHFKKSISRMGQPFELWFDYNNVVPRREE